MSYKFQCWIGFILVGMQVYVSNGKTPAETSYMCSCFDPWRASLKNAPLSKVITDYSDSKDCLRTQVVECPHGSPNERLGVIIEVNVNRKGCTIAGSGIPALSIMAVNNLGYPYGKMMLVNKIMRGCSTSSDSSFPSIVNELDPISNACPGLDPNKTLYHGKDPEWLSIAPNYKLQDQNKKSFLLQFALVDKIKTNEPHPTSIQFVLEFFNIYVGWDRWYYTYYRTKSEHLQLKFATDGTVDVASSKRNISDVTLDQDYFSSNQKMTCKKPPADTRPPTGQLGWILCRPLVAGSTPPSNSEIRSCATITFNHDPSAVFYVSLSINFESCSKFTVDKVLFNMLTRSPQTTQIGGEWSQPVKSDYVTGKCYGDKTTFIPRENPNTIKSCDPDANDKKLYLSLKPMSQSSIVCGKWKPTADLKFPLDIQPVVAIYFKKESKYYSYDERLPHVYEISKPSSSFVVAEIAKETHPWTKILLSSDPIKNTTTTPPTIEPPKPWKSFMCGCADPRRKSSGLPFPTDPIIEVNSAKNKIKDCFELELRDCTQRQKGTEEQLGLVFTQKKCSLDLRTVDISVIAINENGFPYGKMTVVNQFLRSCYKTNYHISYMTFYEVYPIISNLDPISYKCNGISSDDSLFDKKDPEWLSVKANMTATAKYKSAIQFGIVHQIKTTAPYPKHLQFILEFSVENAKSAGNGVAYYRMRSQHLKLMFNDKNLVQRSSYRSDVIPFDIKLDPDYLFEGNPVRKCTTPSADKLPPPGQEKWMFCRDMETSKPTRPFDTSIQNCLKFFLQYDSNSKPQEFYLSMTINSDCGSYKVEQLMFQMLSRDPTQSQIYGEWVATTAQDFVNGKCYDNSVITRGNPKKSNRFSVQSCSGKDNKIYFYYKSIKSNDVVCAKWKLLSSPTEIPLEIQPVFKLNYLNGKTELTYEGHVPIIYELHESNTYLSINHNEPVPRADILLSKDPFLSKEPKLAKPKPRISSMCDCVSPRRSLRKIDFPKKPITDVATSSLKNCFELKLVQCEQSQTLEQVGIIFIQKNCPGIFNLTTIDISVIGINHLGFAYGKLAVMNKHIRGCFGTNDVNSLVQTINYLDPITYNCSALSLEDAMYVNPEWLSVQANLTTNHPSGQAAIQMGLFNAVYFIAPRPTHLQFIAEFTVEYSSTAGGKKGPVEFYRMLSKSLRVEYDASNYLLHVTDSLLSSTTIDLDPDYIGDSTPPQACLSPQPDTTPPAGQPNWIFCRNMKKYDGNKYEENNAIANCLSILFQNKGTTFYFSVAITSASECAKFGIEQVMFTMLTRGHDGVTQIDGFWSKSYDSDFATGQCFGSSKITAKKSLATSIQSCGSSSSKLHYYYKPIYPNEVVCGKWGISPPAKVIDIQAGFKLYYFSGSKFYSYTGRSLKVFERKGDKIVEIVRVQNPRTDILLSKDPFLPSEPELEKPKPRNSVMCDCKSPRRQRLKGPIHQNTSTIITDLPAKAHPLSSCFKLEFVQCPDHTKGGKEELGALFIQKDCSGAKDLKTIDISVIAINQKGFPYGEIIVFHHALVRNCFNSSVDMTKYKPILHYVDPKAYPCSRAYEKDDILYDGKAPVMTSVDANMTVDSPSAPAVIQMRFREKIKKGLHPTHLQLVAEFSVEYSSGGSKKIEILRIRSEHIMLTFNSGGIVDRSLSPVMKSDISLDVDYAAESAGGQCMTPTNDLLKDLNKRGQLMCRCLEKKATPSTAPVDKCVVTVFNNNPKNQAEFFFSVQKVTPTSNAGVNCKTIKILSVVFTMLMRQSTATTIGTGWSTVNNTDYEKGSCLSSMSIAAKPQMAGKFYKQPCIPGDKPSVELFYHYKIMENDGDIICAKWKYNHKYNTEIQIAFNITYQNNNTVHVYTSRHNNIWEIRKGPQIEAKLISNSANDRIDLLMTALFTHPTTHCIQQPFLPSSDVCDCLSKRHGGFAQDPKSPKSVVTKLDEATNVVPVDCFDFKMVSCTQDGSEPYDTIGALLIIHGKGTNPKCNLNVTIQDISFQVMNGQGFPFGELVHSKFLRSCLSVADMLNKDYNVKTLDFMNPKSGNCDGRFSIVGQVVPGFQYPKVPNWMAVNTAARLAEMEKALVIQIYLKKISGATATKLQFVAEMAIKHGHPSKTGLFSIKTEVYSIGYNSLGYYDPSTLKVATGEKPEPNIVPNPQFYEQILKEAVCKMTSSDRPDGVASPYQHCGCFEFTDPGYATRLLPGNPLHTIFDTCVNFSWNFTSSSTLAEKDAKFYLTTWTPTGPPDCENLDIVGVVLTPLKRVKASGSKNPNSLRGNPHGKFERATLSYAASCPLDPGYEKGGGRLRRPPEDYFTGCIKPMNRTMYFFYYPLTKQRDKGNAFCAPWTIPEENEVIQSRFEFQFAGEFFITDNSVDPPVNYVGLKRTSVFEYFPKKPVSRPGVVYEVAAANMHVNNCDTDICILV